MSGEPRPYYDHEPVYQRIAAAGGRGWDDRNPGQEQGSYVGVTAFLDAQGEPPRGARCLELGCGGGQVSLLAARRGWSAVGVDFAPTAVALARENAAREGLDARFEVADCLALPASLGLFELVLDAHALHCVVEPEERARFLAGARAALAPGGLFFSETMSCEGGFDPAAVDADPETGLARNGRRVWVSLARFEAELRAAGLEPVSLVARPQPEDPVRAGDLLVAVCRAL